MIGTFQSNYYQMQAGDVCMIEIRNNLSEEESELFWKIWRDERDLMFFNVPDRLTTDDNELVRIE